MQIQGIFENIIVNCQNLLIVLLVLLAEFFWKNTIFSKKFWVFYIADIAREMLLDRDRDIPYWKKGPWSLLQTPIVKVL